MLDYVANLARNVLNGHLLSRAEAQELISVSGEDIYDLFYWANKIRIRFKGPQVRFCAIVAAKVGGCSEDCKFCAQSSHYQTAIASQGKLTNQQVLESAFHAGAVGAESFGIVNSGRGPTRSELENWLAPLLRKIAASGKTRACATLGALTPETADFLYANGVRRINHNLETGERFYPEIISTHPYSERLRTLYAAKAAGLSLCSGGIFGMGEQWEDRLDMVFTLRDIGVDVMPVNFLNAIAGTPLESQPKVAPMECLKIISICRFIFPTVELKVAGGREASLRDLQSWIFFAGADSTMIGNYLTTYGRSPELDHQMVHDLGLQWRGYELGPVEPSSPEPKISRVSHTGRYNIPIMYEGDVVLNSTTAATVLT
ncbi:MAG: biotin synthase BioB [Phycisphaerae bacterium]